MELLLTTYPTVGGRAIRQTLCEPCTTAAAAAQPTTQEVRR